MADRDFTERELRRLSRDGDGPGLLKRFGLRSRKELIYMLTAPAAVIDRLFRGKLDKLDSIPIGLTAAALGSSCLGTLEGWVGMSFIAPLLTGTAWLFSGIIELAVDRSDDPLDFTQIARNELKEIEREL